MKTITAIESWNKLLGEDRVFTQSTLLQEAETATFFTRQKIVAILQPSTSQQVSECLTIANRELIPLYPISSGKNWGYGSRVPPQDGCALLDLSQLNRILDFNEELGYVTIEPGVTQAQLYQFLQTNTNRWWMDATGSSVDTSLIGNIVERGFGHTPYGDRFARVCGLEIILPNGELINTGLGQFNNAKAESVYRWGVGPYLDGLFSQSNFGIITKMTLWLFPAPESFQAFYFSIDRDEELPDLIEALRPLRLNGTIPNALHLANKYKVLSSIRQYPWEITSLTPLPDDIMSHFQKIWNFGAWSGSGGLYGTKEQIASHRHSIQKTLKGKVKKLHFIDDFRLKIAKSIAKPYQKVTGIDLSAILKLLEPVYGLMKGIPTNTQIDSSYWRKKSLPSGAKNPDLDRCGLIWCAPVAPLTGKATKEITQIIAQTIVQHEFEPLISMTLITERSLCCVSTIAYDRETPGEDIKAIACHQQLLDRLSDAGYYPYRLGIQSMDVLTKRQDNYQNLLNRLKKSLDPNQILAPDRYCP